MADAVLPSLIAAGAALGGVVVTLIVGEIRDRRRVSEERDREQRADAIKRFEWQRDERRTTYSRFLGLAGETVVALTEVTSAVIRNRHDSDVIADRTKFDGLYWQLNRMQSAILLISGDDVAQGCAELIDVMGQGFNLLNDANGMSDDELSTTGTELVATCIA